MRETLPFKVLPGHYLVRLLPTEETTPSGIVLPETFRENYTDALVLDAGADRETGYCDQLQWAATGDRVIFLEESLQHFDREQRMGVLSESDIIGIYRGPRHDRGLEPANGWVKLLPYHPPLTAPGSRILLPDSVRKRKDCGIVEDWGSGEIRVTGPFRGSRKPILELLNVAEDELRGAKVHFDPQALVVEVTGADDYVDTYLVRARDLLAIETDFYCPGACDECRTPIDLFWNGQTPLGRRCHRLETREGLKKLCPRCADSEQYRGCAELT